MSKRSKILGIVGLILGVVGVILKTNAIAGAAMILSWGAFTFVFGFGASFLYDKITTESRLESKISYAIFFLTIFLIIIGGLFKMLHLPGGDALIVAGILMLPTYLVFFSVRTEGRRFTLRKDRQLACILFTDIQGFTRMMGEDEDKALKALESNRSIQKKLIKKFRGKWIKELGDGSMVIFFTATEAILCAKKIQEEISGLDFKLRMGVHIAEILFTDNDTFGDGVNVASRIASYGNGGEIAFSEGVYQSVQNREDLQISYEGEKEFKNVVYPVKIFKIHLLQDDPEVTSKLTA